MYFVERTLPDIQLNNELPDTLNLNECVFFDIETSGLSPKTSFVFLIGLMFFDGKKFLIRQYFANSKDEEEKVLENFIQDIKNFDTIIHFNGSSFDIPYINSRLSLKNINYSIPQINNIDIYKTIIKNKNILNLDNYKLKSVEEYMGIYREDDLSGKQIINVYNNFIENKDFELRDKILLHNEEDVINLYKILPVVSIIEKNKPLEQTNIQLKNYELHITKNSVTFEGIMNLNLNNDVNVIKNYLTFSWNVNDKIFRLCFTIFNGDLYYLINNYRHYYYIPEIDQAIHKSIIKYYNFEKKILATSKTCYTKETLEYIKLPNKLKINDIKFLSEDPQDLQNCLSLKELKKLKNQQLYELIVNLVLELIK